jgi:hypothetical protein
VILRAVGINPIIPYQGPVLSTVSGVLSDKNMLGVGSRKARERTMVFSA